MRPTDHARNGRFASLLPIPSCRQISALLSHCRSQLGSGARSVVFPAAPAIFCELNLPRRGSAFRIRRYPAQDFALPVTLRSPLTEVPRLLRPSTSEVSILFVRQDTLVSEIGCDLLQLRTMFLHSRRRLGTPWNTASARGASLQMMSPLGATAPVASTKQMT